MVGIGLLTFVAVGIFVFSRKHQTNPVRYRSTVSVRVAQKPPRSSSSGSNRRSNAPTTTAAPVVALSGPQKLALAPATRKAALAAAHMPASTGGSFRAQLNDTEDILDLVATTPARVTANTLAKAWAKVFVTARREAARRQVLSQKTNLARRVKSLHDELRTVDARLTKLMPVLYGGNLRYDNLNGNSLHGKNLGQTGSGPSPAVPEVGNVYALNIAFERIELISQISETATKAAKLNIAQATPDAFAQTLSQRPAVRVTHTQSTTLPALGGLLVGLMLALAAAVLVDRADRTIRDPEEAAAAFAAPVLSIIPGDNEDFAVIAAPLSLAAEAYRGLAAMSIATDRLPRAIMVSTPTGDAHAQVAANFAAALSRLGLTVALMATSSEQDWYLEPFTPGPGGIVRLPELLDRAHAGTLNGHVRDQLPTTDRAPNLVVVPPADQPALHLPIDGLPPLLLALADAGIDVTVIAGPPLLEEADATIVAWATRNVLWAIFPGEITRAEARAAAARLELAGVTPFGVVMVEPRSIGA